MDMQPLQEDDLQTVYNWVDEVPLSRPKKNITRDFSDGVLMAEVIKYYHPRLVEIHNYVATSAVQKKIENWEVLNKKVLKRLGLHITRRDIECIANHVPQAIERVLRVVIYTLENPNEPRKVIRGGRSAANLVASKNILNPQLGKKHNQGAELTSGGGAGKGKTRPFQSSDSLEAEMTASPQVNQNTILARNRSGGKGEAERRVPGGERTREQLQREVDQELLIEKEKSILELKEHVEILEYRIKKLEQLVRLKDSTIKELRRSQGR